jgi:hypothetical protein
MHHQRSPNALSNPTKLNGKIGLEAGKKWSIYKNFDAVTKEQIEARRFIDQSFRMC